MSQSELLPQASKLLVANLVERVVTLASLVVSITIMKTNNEVYEVDSRKFVINYQEVYSYRYIIFSTVVGFAYSLLQIPFAIYYFKTGKRLINRYGFLKFDFYGDKVVSFILATGVGTAFGAIVDLKRRVDSSDNHSEHRSKLDDFFNMAYISAGFLLIGFFSSGVSSVISSLSLAKKG